MSTTAKMLELGTVLPKFILKDVVSGALVDSHASEGPTLGTLVMFICNHCPYVVHVRPRLVQVCNLAVDGGIRVIAINSNSEKTHPEDGPPNMRQMAHADGFRFPFCFDEDQSVARAFAAECTPEFYLFDKDRRLAYRGRFDDSSPGNRKPVTGRELSAAIEAVRAGRSPSPEQHAAVGCSIKWAPR